MNKGIILIIVLGLAVFFYANKKESFDRITTAEVKKRLSQNEKSTLLDVRTIGEYKESHIKGSLLIPLDNLQKEAEIIIPDKKQEIYVYCRSGNRSKTAVGILSKLGYTRVYNAGGIIDWPYTEDVVK